jgi:hypothetical protein
MRDHSGSAVQHGVRRTAPLLIVTPTKHEQLEQLQPAVPSRSEMSDFRGPAKLSLRFRCRIPPGNGVAARKCPLRSTSELKAIIRHSEGDLRERCTSIEDTGALGESVPSAGAGAWGYASADRALVVSVSS